VHGLDACTLASGTGEPHSLPLLPCLAPAFLSRRLSLSVSELTLFHVSSSLFLPLLGPRPVAQGYGENASTELGSHPRIPLPCPSHPLGWRRKGRGVGGGLCRGVLHLLCLSTGRWILQGEGRYDVGEEGCEEKARGGGRGQGGTLKSSSPSPSPPSPFFLLDIPTVTCENERCRRLYHSVCLRQWLQTLPDVKMIRKHRGESDPPGA